ncbi:Putative ubiquitin thioesterase L96, partial [Frankliniella fusca]
DKDVDTSQEIVLTGEGQVRVVPMRGDGSCLLTAILNQVNPEMSSDELKVAASDLRKEVVKYIKKNMSDFRNAILMGVEASAGMYQQKTAKGRIDAYLRNLEKGLEWGGYETLVACSKIKEVSIKVLQEVWQDPKNATSILIENTETKLEEPLTIVYRISQDPEERQKKTPKRNHYDSFHSFITNSDDYCETEESHQTKVAEESFSSKSTPVKMPVNSGASPESSEFSSLSPGFESQSSDDLLTTDDELHEYYAPGQWESFPTFHKKSEKARWALYLDALAVEEDEPSGQIISPFQGQAVPSSSKNKRKRRRRQPKRIVLSDSGQDDEIATQLVKEHELTEGQAKSSNNTSYRRPINSDEASSGKPSPESKRSKKKTKARKKVKRDIGQQITFTNCLPEFSERSKQSLEMGRPDWRAILADLRAHTHGLIGNDYPKKDEYDILCSTFIKQFPCTADPDNPKGYSQVKLKFRKSLSQMEFYTTTLKTKRLTERANKENFNPIVVVKERRPENVDELDKKLQEANENSDSNLIKQLILKTYQDRNIKFKALEGGVEGSVEMWATYPHLQSFQMLSYEYSLLLKKTHVDLATNMKKIMDKLKVHYHLETENEKLKEIKILDRVYEDITPVIYRKIGMVPALDIKDEMVIQNGPGQDQNERHSPRVLVMTRFGNDGMDIPIWSFLIGSGKVLSKCEEPGALEVTVQLLAAYFIMDLEYPNSYKSFLRFLEKAANGGLCLQTLKQTPHDTYSRFMRITGLQEQL